MREFVSKHLFTFGLLCVMALIFSGQLSAQDNKTPFQIDSTKEPVTIPFELVGRHICVHVTVRDSAPLCFIFDTGDKVGVIDLAKAKALGLETQGKLAIGG